MKKQFLFALGLLSALSGFCQAPISGHPIVLPDLVCAVSRAGNEIVVTVTNWPPDSRGCGRSAASVTIGSSTQSVAVPELGPEGTFQKRIAIPSALLSGPFKVGVKVDAAQKINESNENNNSCSQIFNQPDLKPVLVSGFDILDVRTDAQFLYFSVTNAGDGNAASSITRFSYHLANNQRQTIDIPTPPIQAGRTIELRVSPNTCSSRPPSGDCYWDVLLDVGKTVKESDETNNTASGSTQG